VSAIPESGSVGRALGSAGERVLGSLAVLREIGAFGLIALGVTLSKLGTAPRVVRPLLFEQVRQVGLRLLPMTLYLGAALGLVIIGQTVALLSQVGAEQYIGTVMVTVVIRELGPLLTAILVLARAGTATVVELGTMRALQEVRALEALGIDPIHYLVVPRLFGLAISVACLSTYLVLAVVGSGWVFAFLQDVPLRPAAYFGQLADSLRWLDFLLFALKTSLFGVVIAVVCCYHGLARPLGFFDIAKVAERAVVEGVVACVLLDVLFLAGYAFA
jgi:phospholipid/cholesterol/gamma-HCH transport system permease protein